MTEKLAYLDVCALSRPFDNQNYLRVRLETDAVNLILSKVKDGKYKLIFSPVHEREIATISDLHERSELQAVMKKYGVYSEVNIAETRERADELIREGFGVADAAHIAFAEKMGASFITCDDKLIKKCLSHKVRIWCGNPVAYADKEGMR